MPPKASLRQGYGIIYDKKGVLTHAILSCANTPAGLCDNRHLGQQRGKREYTGIITMVRGDRSNAVRLTLNNYNASPGP